MSMPTEILLSGSGDIAHKFQVAEIGSKKPRADVLDAIESAVGGVFGAETCLLREQQDGEEEQSAEEGGVRIDGPHGTAEVRPNLLPVSRCSRSFRTASAFLLARRQLKQSHWVVLLLDAAKLRSDLSPAEELSLPDSAETRFLILLYGGEPDLTQAARALARRFSWLGLRLFGTADPEFPGSVAEQLEQIRDRGRAGLLCLKSVSAAAPVQAAPAGSSLSEVSRGSPEPSVERQAEEQLCELACCDPRLNVVAMNGWEWPRFRSEFPQRFFEVGDPGESALSWTGALAAAGCRPVILLSRGLLRRYREQIEEGFCRPRLAVTFLVEQKGQGLTPDGDASGVAPLPARLFSDAKVLMAGNPAELRIQIASACSWNGPAVVILRSAANDATCTPGHELDGSEFRPDFLEAAERPNGEPEPLLPALSAEWLLREREAASRTALSSDVQRWICAYERVGFRSRYLWRWCRYGIDLTTLPCVQPDMRPHLCDTKLLSVILCVLLDDIADRRPGTPLLDALLDLPLRNRPDLSHLEREDRDYVLLARAIWDDYQARTQAYPLHGVFARLLEYDLAQFFNMMRYANLVTGNPALLNTIEHDLYLPHNMMMLSFSTLDLMASPAFRMNELGGLREAIWHAQYMGRIGNVLSTWQREVEEGDYTSGLFARAVMRGDLTLDQLKSADSGNLMAVIRDGGHERYYRSRWTFHRKCFLSKASSIQSLDLTELVDGHDRFLAMHLGSQGLI